MPVLVSRSLSHVPWPLTLSRFLLKQIQTGQLTQIIVFQPIFMVVQRALPLTCTLGTVGLNNKQNRQEWVVAMNKATKGKGILQVGLA